MTEEQKKLLETQLWNIANELRGKIMNADESANAHLGFIFYKYLSERLHVYANGILAQDGIEFDAIDEATPEGARRSSRREGLRRSMRSATS